MGTGYVWTRSRNLEGMVIGYVLRRKGGTRTSCKWGTYVEDTLSRKLYVQKSVNSLLRYWLL